MLRQALEPVAGGDDVAPVAHDGVDTAIAEGIMHLLAARGVHGGVVPESRAARCKNASGRIPKVRNARMATVMRIAKRLARVACSAPRA